jgi:hypothetical protein
MSQAVAADELPDRAVRNRGQFASVLHRDDPESDGPEPACPEGDRPGADFTAVRTASYPTYDLCGNPECFGGDWR